MKKTKYGIIVSLLLAVFFAACKSDDDDITYTDECYISSFVLGQLKRQVVTSDSSYTISFSGSLYPLSIDQVKQTITNAELFPKGTILTAALATITAKGVVIYAPVADTTQWKAYSSSDSINFSQPLFFRVYAQDGSGCYKQYTMNLKVRENDPTSFTWSQPDSIESLADKVNAKLLFFNQTPIILSTDANGNYTAIKGLLSGSFWEELPHTWVEQSCTGAEDGEILLAQVYDGRFWMSTTDGRLLVSTNGIQWEDVPQADGTSIQLMAASATALYARIQHQDDISYAASADGQTWVNVGMEHEELFAGTEAAVTYTQKNGNPRVLIASDIHHTADKPLAVWNLLEGAQEPWTLFSIEDGINPYLLPNQTPLSLMAYNGWLVAATQQEFYFSYDNGITWKEDANLSLPADVRAAVGSFTTAAQGEYIWVVAGKYCLRLRYNGYQE